MNVNSLTSLNNNLQKGGEASASSVDENYLVIGSHVDSVIQLKIINHEYVDFSKLLPRGRTEDDHRMELVSRAGSTYFVHVSERESIAIISFHRWEQAFRIFSNIYTKHYPER